LRVLVGLTAQERGDLDAFLILVMHFPRLWCRRACAGLDRRLLTHRTLLLWLGVGVARHPVDQRVDPEPLFVLFSGWLWALLGLWLGLRALLCGRRCFLCSGTQTCQRFGGWRAGCRRAGSHESFLRDLLHFLVTRLERRDFGAVSGRWQIVRCIIFRENVITIVFVVGRCGFKQLWLLLFFVLRFCGDRLLLLRDGCWLSNGLGWQRLDRKSVV